MNKIYQIAKNKSKEPKHDKERLSFQMERFIFFSDGVFAICITLLIIEIKVPELAMPTDKLLWQSLGQMSLRFLGFLISFGIVGHYWSVHHRIFGYVVKYSSSLLWLNLGYLFTVVLLPFSSAFLGEYGSYSNLKIPYGVYTFNMCLTGFMNCWLWLYVSNPKRRMLTRIISPASPARIIPQPDHTGGFPFIIPGISDFTRFFKVPFVTDSSNASLGYEKPRKKSRNR